MYKYRFYICVLFYVYVLKKFKIKIEKMLILVYNIVKVGIIFSYS